MMEQFEDWTAVVLRALSEVLDDNEKISTVTGIELALPYYHKYFVLLMVNDAESEILKHSSIVSLYFLNFPPCTGLSRRKIRV